MPRPTLPAEVDKTPLSADASAYLGRLVDLLYTKDPMRPAADILFQATASFRLAWQASSGEWTPRALIRLGNDAWGLVMRNPAVPL